MNFSVRAHKSMAQSTIDANRHELQIPIRSCRRGVAGSREPARRKLPPWCNRQCCRWPSHPVAAPPRPPRSSR
jgi:hypothetical protein